MQKYLSGNFQFEKLKCLFEYKIIKYQNVVAALQNSILLINFVFVLIFTGFCGIELFAALIRSVARRGKRVASARKRTTGTDNAGQS